MREFDSVGGSGSVIVIKEHPIYSGYFVSDEGLVFDGSDPLVIHRNRGSGGKYQTVFLKRFRAFRYVHRLVLETFVGLCPVGLEACHNDGVGSNNQLGNLRWDTHESNVRDQKSHGTFPDRSGPNLKTRGENHYGSVLSIGDVLTIRYIRELTRKKWGAIRISRALGVCSTTVVNVLVGHSWSWLQLIRYRRT